MQTISLDTLTAAYSRAHDFQLGTITLCEIAFHIYFFLYVHVAQQNSGLWQYISYAVYSETCKYLISRMVLHNLIFQDLNRATIILPSP